ncbi:hypothetical protein [Acinetobacter cumulans]|uniref:hypothetical protein n=1 Tax=Acinetobacter cumulans TaxID=2136182 RepID=UPI00207B8E59|nr:hypothetical protein [Acinetobacter cumulans]
MQYLILNSDFGVAGYSRFNGLAFNFFFDFIVSTVHAKLFKFECQRIVSSLEVQPYGAYGHGVAVKYH